MTYWAKAWSGWSSNAANNSVASNGSAADCLAFFGVFWVALARDFRLEIAQTLIFPKLYASPSGVYREPSTRKTFGISDRANPAAGAAAEAEFVIEDAGDRDVVSVRA